MTKPIKKSEIIGLKINSDETHFIGADFPKCRWEMHRDFFHETWKLGQFKGMVVSFKGKIQHMKTSYCLFKIAEDFVVEDAYEFSFGKTSPSVVYKKVLAYIEEKLKD